MLNRITIIFGVVLIACVFLYEGIVKKPPVPAVAFGDVSGVFVDSDPNTILFVGDVMLARGVEERVMSDGMTYLFEGMNAIFEPDMYVVGNFEGIAPKEHKKTPPLTMRFSVREEYLAKLKGFGFNSLSLSNNHALDYGDEAYENTRNVCSEYDIECFGHPVKVSDDSVVYVQEGDTTVAILALHTLYGGLDEIRLGSLIEQISQKSGLQVVYIHWGPEYDLFHGKDQELFAHKLIDNGVDAIVGHHPHVVQDIEIYKGKPIFYSLGNFIFDQYFSDDVQKGLMVKQVVYDETIEYVLLPITSIGTRNQPHIMSDEEAAQFLSTLSERSDEAIKRPIKEGKIVITK